MILKINNQTYQVTAPFGSIDNMHSTGHTGIDLAMPVGTPIYSPTTGVVDNIVNYGNDNVGLGVIVKTPDGNHLILGHLSKVDVKIGDKISFGQKLAESGNSGHSSGAHLHIGLVDNTGRHFLDPTKYEQNLQAVSANHQGLLAHVKDNYNQLKGDYTAMQNDVSSVAGFINDMKQNGLFHAMFRETFHDAMQHFWHWLGEALLSCNDLLFLMPAIAFAFLTFLIGKNRFTKWILPLTFIYSVTEILFIMNGGQN